MQQNRYTFLMPKNHISRTIVLFSLLALAVSASAQVDHTPAQSPVKNQGDRGTCVAFAINATLETFPGIPTNLSEQLLYATVKLHQNQVDRWLRESGRKTIMDEGDLFDAYVPLFDLIGTCHGVHLPYDPRVARAGPNVPEPIRAFLELTHVTPSQVVRIREAAGKYGFRMADCEVLDQTKASDIDRLKRLLDEGVQSIPMGYRVHIANWSNARQTGNHHPAESRPIIHPGMMDQFAPKGAAAAGWMSYNQARVQHMRAGTNLLDALQSGEWVRRPHSEPTAYGGHAVTIVGYNDHGFIIKNSWGVDWADKGYAIVNYDFHRLYVIQGLLIQKADIRIPNLSPFEKRQRIEQAQYRLKVQPRVDGGVRSLSLSTWTLDLRDPDVELAEYRVEMLAGNTWRPLLTQIILAGDRNARNGAELRITGPLLEQAEQASSLRITVRYGDMPLGDPTRPQEFRFLTERRYPPVAMPVRHTIDLTPMPR